MNKDKILESKEGDAVNHPPHYNWLKKEIGIEVIDIVRHMDFDLGNAIKYILRAGRKPLSDNKSNEDYNKAAIQDLKKAIWYIEDKIAMLNNI